MLGGVGGVQKWLQEARWQNLEDDIQDPWSSTSQRPEKAHTAAVELLQAIFRVFPAHPDGLFFKHANRHTKMNSCHSLNPIWKSFFYGIQGSIQ